MSGPPWNLSFTLAPRWLPSGILSTDTSYLALQPTFLLAAAVILNISGDHNAYDLLFRVYVGVGFQGIRRIDVVVESNFGRAAFDDYISAAI